MFLYQEAILFDSVIFRVLDAKLNSCTILGQRKDTGCVSVEDSLLYSEGFASHPIMFGKSKREIRKADEAITEVALQAPGRSSVLVYAVCLLTSFHAGEGFSSVCLCSSLL